MAISLAAGWNLVALPYQPASTYLAQTVLNEINSQGGMCTEIDRWVNGGWEAHFNGLPFNNFEVLPGQGYFIRCSVDSTWTMEGTEFTAGLPLILEAGWNMVGVPYPPNTYTAQSYLDHLNSQGNACAEIDRWLNGGWEAHYNGLPFNNFTIEPEHGYFVRCTQVNKPVDLVLQKADGDVLAGAGEVISYTLSYNNNGYSPATGVVITETLPANTSFYAGESSVGWQLAVAPDTYTYSVGSLGLGASGSVVFAVTVNDPLPAGVTSVSNSAQIGDDGSQGPDLNPDDNHAALTTQLAVGPTNVCGTITSDTTWKRSGSPFLVTCDITVNPGVTLTVEAGAAVKFNHNGMTVYGTLLGQGTASRPVYFSSYRDDSAGGDSNGDGSASSPNHGDWNQIHLDGGAASFDYTTVRYGGAVSPFSNLYVTNRASLALRDGTVSHGHIYGMYLDGESISLEIARSSISQNAYGVFSYGSTNTSYVVSIDQTTFHQNSGYALNMTRLSAPVLTNNTFTNNGEVATINIYTGAPALRGNSGSNNTQNAFWVSGQFSTPATFPKLTGLVYRLGGLSANAPVTIEAGVIFKMAFTSPTFRAGLDIQGTAGEPVIFTSYKDDSVGGDSNGDGSASAPAPGDWYNIQVQSSTSTIDYMNTRYGGASSMFGSLYVTQGANLTIQNSTISDGLTHGLYLYGPNIALNLSNVTVRDHGSDGILTNNQAGTGYSVNISNTSIRNNGGVGLRLVNLTAGTIGYSNIYGNTGGGIYALPVGVLDASNNYWGAVDGPAPFGSGNSINTYEEWDEGCQCFVTKPAVQYLPYLSGPVALTSAPAVEEGLPKRLERVAWGR